MHCDDIEFDEIGRILELSGDDLKRDNKEELVENRHEPPTKSIGASFVLRRYQI